MTDCTAIVLHNDAVRAHERAQKRRAILALRTGRPGPATREQHKLTLGIRSGVYCDPFRKPMGPVDVMHACRSCGALLLVVSMRTGHVVMPCSWCAQKRDPALEAAALARLDATLPPRLVALDTSRPPRTMPHGLVFAALLLAILTAAGACLEKHHQDERRASEIKTGIA